MLLDGVVPRFAVVSVLTIKAGSERLRHCRCRLPDFVVEILLVYGTGTVTSKFENSTCFTFYYS
jgi:hypothetical protein